MSAELLKPRMMAGKARREGVMSAMPDARRQLDQTLEREARDYGRASEIIEAEGGPRLDPFDLVDMERLPDARKHFHWIARGIIAGLKHAPRAVKGRPPSAGDVVRSIEITLTHVSGVRTITHASGWDLEAAATQAEALAAKHSGGQTSVTSISYKYHATVLLPAAAGLAAALLASRDQALAHITEPGPVSPEAHD